MSEVLVCPNLRHERHCTVSLYRTGNRRVLSLSIMREVAAQASFDEGSSAQFRIFDRDGDIVARLIHSTTRAFIFQRVGFAARRIYLRVTAWPELPTMYRPATPVDVEANDGSLEIVMPPWVVLPESKEWMS